MSTTEEDQVNIAADSEWVSTDGSRAYVRGFDDDLVAIRVKYLNDVVVHTWHIREEFGPDKYWRPAPKPLPEPPSEVWCQFRTSLAAARKAIEEKDRRRKVESPRLGRRVSGWVTPTTTDTHWPRSSVWTVHRDHL